MKKTTLLLTLFLTLFLSEVLISQFRTPNRFGRGRSSIPQAQVPEKEPEPLTAEEMVDQQMPKVIEALALDPFEEAVVRSILVKYVRKRMELQILQLEPTKMREEFNKLFEMQDEELKAGLPEEKYQAFTELQQNNFQAKRKKKKKKKKNKT